MWEVKAVGSAEYYAVTEYSKAVDDILTTEKLLNKFRKIDEEIQ